MKSQRSVGVALRTAIHLSRYVLTGGVAALVDIGGFALLSGIRVAVVPAAACSFLMATVVNFFLTARWVFHAPVNLRGYILFLSGATSGALINIALTAVSVTLLGWPRIDAKVIAVVMTFLLNFWVYAFVVFRIKSR